MCAMSPLIPNVPWFMLDIRRVSTTAQTAEMEELAVGVTGLLAGHVGCLTRTGQMSSRLSTVDSGGTPAMKQVQGCSDMCVS